MRWICGTVGSTGQYKYFLTPNFHPCRPRYKVCSIPKSKFLAWVVKHRISWLCVPNYLHLLGDYDKPRLLIAWWRHWQRLRVTKSKLWPFSSSNKFCSKWRYLQKPWVVHYDVLKTWSKLTYLEADGLFLYLFIIQLACCEIILLAWVERRFSTLELS